MDNNGLIMRMTEYYTGQPHRIQHFMKVYAYARMLGEMEQIPRDIQEVLEVAAIVHDIGIKVSEEKYGDCNGKHQEEEGPAVAELILNELGYEEMLIQRVSYLVGHHHTYNDIDGIDYQLLVEADFLVNLFENESTKKPAEAALHRIFKTESGKAICKMMFRVED